MATTNKKNPLLQDAGIERTVISGIIAHGHECLLEIQDLLKPEHFYSKVNKKIYEVLSYMVNTNNTTQFDLPSIIATAKSLYDENLVDSEKDYEFLQAISEDKVTYENTLHLSTFIYKLALARQAYLTLNSTQKKILASKGNEDINDIISMIESPVYELTSSLVGNENKLMQIGDDIDEILKNLAATPKDIVGLPSGFPKWDKSIGGGLRRASINVVAARMKVGKSFWCLNVAKNLAMNKIPVLYLDTELTKETQMFRLLSAVSGVEFDDIETGKFAKKPEQIKAIKEAKEIIKTIPITHRSIAGESVTAVTSIMRRWISKEVGIGDDGQANPCLIIYDYLKLMDSSDIQRNMQEHQLIGFLMTNLHNFSVKWGIPILATVQLNRDGVNDEGTQTISASDRIGWLCTNLTILKNKSDIEFNTDPPVNGTKKLVVLATRFGGGMEKGDYINIKENLSCSLFTEANTYSQNTTDAFKNYKK
jgi:replicative DNA helicase